MARGIDTLYTQEGEKETISKIEQNIYDSFLQKKT